MIDVRANGRWGRRAAVVLALAALAVTGALVLRSPDPGLAAINTQNISVQASLDACTEPGDGRNRNCEIAVAFDEVAEAVQYQATITAPSGSILLNAPAEPSGSSYSVPYVGNGTYGVRITAYGPSD